MVALPDEFLNWNYYPRREMLIHAIREKRIEDMNEFLLESTRHNPALCTAGVDVDGSLLVNGKIVGVGYVLKEDLLDAVTSKLLDHIENGDKMSSTALTKREKRRFLENYQVSGMRILLECLYMEPNEARKKVDFEKLCTLELATSIREASKHTWANLRSNKRACMLFYRPPVISYELHGRIEVHENTKYATFVNAVHDAFHYTQPEYRSNKPAYLFDVEKVFDNSPTDKGFGRRIA